MIAKPIVTILERCKATMVLAAVGDAMGYCEGDWYFCQSSQKIHQEMMSMTKGKGVLALNIAYWHYSDDTVMHIATAKALLNCKLSDPVESMGVELAKYYKKCMKKMAGRAPGGTCINSMSRINADGSNWQCIGFSGNGGGCGAAMRSACIGLVFWYNIKKLIAVSIESGRITHHNPIGYMGAMVASYFTALAIKKVPVSKWPVYLFEYAFPLSEAYIKEHREAAYNLYSEGWKNFITAWSKYIYTRGLKYSIYYESIPKFPYPYGITERDNFYDSVAINGWPGALGLDSVLIAYDALLGAKDSWEYLCLRGVLHGGDNDSTGTIAAAWFGALYGFHGVPYCHMKDLEDQLEIEELGKKLYEHSVTKY